jgi:hypothetical protein
MRQIIKIYAKIKNITINKYTLYKQMDGLKKKPRKEGKQTG